MLRGGNKERGKEREKDEVEGAATCALAGGMKW